ncbi:MAG: hypothetical protein KAG98_07195 [Lentisphaeria bacterium]|nr:hypothetical protein [Lentisphaeria bacterium]
MPKFLLLFFLITSVSVFAKPDSWIEALKVSREAKALFLEGHFPEAGVKYQQALKLLKVETPLKGALLVKEQRAVWLRDLSICNKFSKKKTSSLSLEEQLAQQKSEMVLLLKKNYALQARLRESDGQSLKIKALQDQVVDLKSERDSLMNSKEQEKYLHKRKQQDQVYVMASLRARQVYSKSYQNLKRVNAGLTNRNITLQRSIEDFKKQQRKLIGSSFYETIQSEISDLKLSNDLLTEKLKAFEGQALSPNKTIDILQQSNYELRTNRDQFYRKLEKYTGDAFEEQLALAVKLKKKNKQLESLLKHFEVLSTGSEQIMDHLFKEASTHNITENRLEFMNTLISNLEKEVLFLKEELVRQKIENQSPETKN